ncbi:uncharacterized protein LOC121250652 isoform X2 [Juglans microcarpa x Juglans regia]|uniref:uncharacterized protein LOC121250652 isoform X2 n=1 Tax=Juglans microcarpa x Juglans regia TaxID=2249226 RepID=UPI001B7DA928|nr:uncharacterized protein LOC121250652 isoform X2 [Juglans microcarpa x Juglans regia]
MEELRKLEQVQRMLQFMELRGVAIPSNGDSNRFLANLILLLIQPCGELDLDKKRSLVSEHMSKISTAFLDDASIWLSREGITEVTEEVKDKDNRCCPCQNLGDNSLQLDYDSRLHAGSLETDFEDMALVGLDAMQRANSTLEDFCRSYFMFHEMEVNRLPSLFKYLPVLSFTESFIYQLDSLNEKILRQPTSGVTVSERGHKPRNERLITKFTDPFKSNPFWPLVGLLEYHGLLTERIREEFRCGEEYWALERKLCCALMSKEEISVEDVMRAIHLKSFDYRVLNLLLYHLRGEKVNDLHMEFLSVSEFLVEVSDDLFDYEDDVIENSFNVLRMFVRIYGASKAPVMLAKYITEAEQKYDCLLKTLDPQLSSNYQKRCEEATKEGGKISGHRLGAWSIPPVIVDEELYRSNFAKF